MNDCQINESQKLFVMGSFQFRFVATSNSSSVSSCSCPLLLRFGENNQTAISYEFFFSVFYSVLRDDNLIQLIGFDTRRTPASLEASVYIFSFSFSEVSSVKYHSQSHWLN